MGERKEEGATRESKTEKGRGNRGRRGRIKDDVRVNVSFLHKLRGKRAGKEKQQKVEGGENEEEKGRTKAKL